MDRITGLRLFAAAVEAGSLAGAGRRFSLSPAVAGKHVAALEDELGVRLLQRTTRRLALTEAGQAFLPRCRRVLGEFDEALAEAGDTRRVVQGTLRVSAPTEYGVNRLGAALASFAIAHPALQVDLRLDDRYVDLVEQGVDVALRIGRLTDDNLVTRRLGQCELLLCASPGFLATRGTPRSPADLAGLPRLAFSQSVSAGDWTLVGPDGSVQAVDGPVALSANNVQLLAEVAERDAGIVYGPDFVFASALAAGTLVRVLPAWKAPSLDVHAVFPALRGIPRKVRLFVDHLAARMAAQAEAVPAGLSRARRRPGPHR